jgi:Uma2 family endonuclease
VTDPALADRPILSYLSLMADPAKPLPDRITIQEFLACDDGTDTRYELIDGRPVAMAPPSPSRSTITGNMAGVLYGRLRPPCRVRIEYGIGLPSDDDRYY